MLQHSLDFLKNQRQRLPGNVDDGIKGDDSGQAVVGNLERHHVSFAKRNVGIQLACLLYHAWRKVEAKNGCTGLMQESRDVTRAAAYVAYLATTGSRAGKTLEQFAIERFVLEFVGDSAGVFFGEAIVTFANCFGEEVGHGDRTKIAITAWLTRGRCRPIFFCPSRRPLAQRREPADAVFRASRKAAAETR